MNLNLTGRGASALLLLTAIYFCTVSASLFANGNKDQSEDSSKQLARTLVWSEPAEKPEWVDVVPQRETEIYFVGTSQIFDTTANARDNARESARIQVLEYYGQVIEKQATALSSVSGSTRDTLNPYINREDEIRVFAQNVVSEVATVAYFTEMYLNSNNKEEYIVYTLHRINREKAEEEISGYAKNISSRYTAAFSQWKTLKAALEGYTFIVKSLERNPLHRIMAYCDTPKGRAGLYEYARLQIIELANSLSIEAIPFRRIQETETLTTPIKIRSSLMPATGLLDCHASIFGTNSDNIPPFPFNSASDNHFDLAINNNNNIKPGSYNVTIEILLSNLTGNIVKNITSSFTFEIISLTPLYETREDVEAGIKKAVDILAIRLKTSTETIIGPFLITEKNVPSELSDFLMEKVTHYATENQERKYKIVEGVGITPGDGKNIAVLNGFFTKRDDRVDVTLKLSTPDRDADGSQIFSISLAVLEPKPPLEKGTKEFFIGTWVATTEYNNSFDTYRISFFNNDSCRVTLSNDTAEQETTGNWLWNGSTLTLTVKAVFRDAKITYQLNIDWVSRVGFVEDNNVFRIIVRLTANSPITRLTFFRE
jgi:hypothetical protein